VIDYLEKKQDLNLLNNMDKFTIKEISREISSNLLIFVSLIFGYSIGGVLNHNYFWFFGLIPSAIFIFWHFYNIIKSYRQWKKLK